MRATNWSSAGKSNNNSGSSSSNESSRPAASVDCLEQRQQEQQGRAERLASPCLSSSSAAELGEQTRSEIENHEHHERQKAAAANLESDGVQQKAEKTTSGQKEESYNLYESTWQEPQRENTEKSPKEATKSSAIETSTSDNGCGETLNSNHTIKQIIIINEPNQVSTNSEQQRQSSKGKEEKNDSSSLARNIIVDAKETTDAVTKKEVVAVEQQIRFEKEQQQQRQQAAAKKQDRKLVLQQAPRDFSDLRLEKQQQQQETGGSNAANFRVAHTCSSSSAQAVSCGSFDCGGHIEVASGGVGGKEQATSTTSRPSDKLPVAACQKLRLFNQNTILSEREQVSASDPVWPVRVGGAPCKQQRIKVTLSKPKQESAEDNREQEAEEEEAHEFCAQAINQQQQRERQLSATSSQLECDAQTDDLVCQVRARGRSTATLISGSSEPELAELGEHELTRPDGRIDNDGGDPIELLSGGLHASKQQQTKEENSEKNNNKNKNTRSGITRAHAEGPICRSVQKINQISQATNSNSGSEGAHSSSCDKPKETTNKSTNKKQVLAVSSRELVTKSSSSARAELTRLEQENQLRRIASQRRRAPLPAEITKQQRECSKEDEEDEQTQRAASLRKAPTNGGLGVGVSTRVSAEEKLERKNFLLATANRNSQQQQQFNIKQQQAREDTQDDRQQQQQTFGIEQQTTIKEKKKQQQVDASLPTKQLAIYINGKIRSNSIFCSRSVSSNSFTSILKSFQSSSSPPCDQQQQQPQQLACTDSLQHEQQQLLTVKIEPAHDDDDKTQTGDGPREVDSRPERANKPFVQCLVPKAPNGVALNNQRSFLEKSCSELRCCCFPVTFCKGQSLGLNDEPKTTTDNLSEEDNETHDDLRRTSFERQHTTVDKSPGDQSSQLRTYKLNPSSMFLRKAMRYYRLWIYSANLTILLGAIIFILSALYVASDYRFQLIIATSPSPSSEALSSSSSFVGTASSQNSSSSSQLMSRNRSTEQQPNNSNNNSNVTTTLVAFSGSAVDADHKNHEQEQSQHRRSQHVTSFTISLSEPTIILAYLMIAFQLGLLQALGCFGAIQMKERLIQAFWYLILALIVADVTILIYWLQRYDLMLGSLKDELTSRLERQYNGGGHSEIDNELLFDSSTFEVNLTLRNKNEREILQHMENYAPGNTRAQSEPSIKHQNKQHSSHELAASIGAQFDKIFSRIFDTIQSESQCCGVVSSLDYKRTRWRQLRVAQLRKKILEGAAEDGMNIESDDAHRDQDQVIILDKLLAQLPLVPASCCRRPTQQQQQQRSDAVLDDDGRRRRPHEIHLDDSKLPQRVRVPAWSPSMVVDNLIVGYNHPATTLHQSGRNKALLDGKQGGTTTNKEPAPAPPPGTAHQGSELPIDSEQEERLQQARGEPTLADVIDRRWTGLVPSWQKADSTTQRQQDDEDDDKSYLNGAAEEKENNNNDEKSKKTSRLLAKQMHYATDSAGEQAQEDDEKESSRKRRKRRQLELLELAEQKRVTQPLVEVGMELGQLAQGEQEELKEYSNGSKQLDNSTENCDDCKSVENEDETRATEEEENDEDDENEEQDDERRRPLEDEKDANDESDRRRQYRIKNDGLSSSSFSSSSSSNPLALRGPRAHIHSSINLNALPTTTMTNDRNRNDDDDSQIAIRRERDQQPERAATTATATAAVDGTRSIMQGEDDNDDYSWAVETELDKRGRVLSRLVKLVSSIGGSSSAGGLKSNGPSRDSDMALQARGLSRNASATNINGDKLAATTTANVQLAELRKLVRAKWPNNKRHELGLTRDQIKLIESYLSDEIEHSSSGSGGGDATQSFLLTDDDGKHQQKTTATTTTNDNKGLRALSRRSIFSSSTPAEQSSADNTEQKQQQDQVPSNEDNKQKKMARERMRLEQLKRLRALLEQDEHLASCLPRSHYDEARIYTRGCQAHIRAWIQSSANILFVMGFCVLTVLKFCSLILLRLEIREMIHKIRVLKGMATEYNALQDLEPYLPRPSICAQAAELTPTGVTSALVSAGSPAAIGPSGALGAAGELSGSSPPPFGQAASDSGASRVHHSGAALAASCSSPTNTTSYMGGQPLMAAPRRLGGSFSEAVAAATAVAHQQKLAEQAQHQHQLQCSQHMRHYERAASLVNCARASKALGMGAVCSCTAICATGGGRGGMLTAPRVGTTCGQLCPCTSSLSMAAARLSHSTSQQNQSQAAAAACLSPRSGGDLFPPLGVTMPRRHTAVSVCPAAAAAATAAAHHLMMRRGTFAHVANALPLTGTSANHPAQHQQYQQQHRQSIFKPIGSSSAALSAAVSSANILQAKSLNYLNQHRHSAHAVPPSNLLFAGRQDSAPTDCAVGGGGGTSSSGMNFLDPTNRGVQQSARRSSNLSTSEMLGGANTNQQHRSVGSGGASSSGATHARTLETSLSAEQQDQQQQLSDASAPFRRQASGGAQSAIVNFSLDTPAASAQHAESRRSIH